MEWLLGCVSKWWLSEDPPLAFSLVSGRSGNWWIAVRFRAFERLWLDFGETGFEAGQGEALSASEATMPMKQIYPLSVCQFIVDYHEMAMDDFQKKYPDYPVGEKYAFQDFVIQLAKDALMFTA